MRRFVLRRVAALAVTLLFVSLLVFVVVRVLPGDPALIIVGTEGSAEAAERIRESLGLNRSLIVQYGEWAGRALRGDLGTSIQYDVPVAGLIASRLPVTLPLTLMAAGFMALAAVPVGLFAATHQRRWGDYLAMALSQVGVAVPAFWAGLLLILLFAVKLGWFKSGGFDGWGQTARAKGLGEGVVLFRHALRNAMIPIITVAGIQLGQLMAGSIVLESVFYLPGLGRLAIGAISARDLPVVQGVVLFVACVIVTLNVVVDLLYAFIDPRIRYE